MKTPLTYGFVTVLSCLVLSTGLRAQVGSPEFDPLGEFDDLPKLIRVQVEFIDVSHEQLTELMFGPKTSANDDELRKQVAKLVKDGKASIMETMLCIARSGQKATSESIEEFIYPTEYEPAELPNDIHFKNEKDAQEAKVNRRDFATGPTPTAFETRNLGSTLEIEPTLDVDNTIIDLRIVPEIVYHVGNKVWAEWKGHYGEAPVQMPKFYTVRLNTSFTLFKGQYLMVSALSPKDAKGFPDFTRKLMVFVKADVITPGR